jgi:hypothetical protein
VGNRTPLSNRRERACGSWPEDVRCDVRRLLGIRTVISPQHLHLPRSGLEIGLYPSLP